MDDAAPYRSPTAPSDSTQGNKLSKRGHRHLGGLPYASLISHIPSDCARCSYSSMWARSWDAAIASDLVDLCQPGATPLVLTPVR